MKSNIKLIPHSIVVLISKEGKILFEERKDDGFFDFPGGGIEEGETPEEAAKRELKEETGLEAINLELFEILEGEVTYYKYYNGNEIYGIDHIYLCRNYEGELIPQLEEVKGLYFKNLDDIPVNLFSNRNKKVAEDLKLKGII